MQISDEKFRKKTDKDDICKQSIEEDEKIPKRKNSRKISRKSLWIIIAIAAAIIIAIIISVVVFLVIKGNKDSEEKKDDQTQNKNGLEKSGTSGERIGPKEKEFDIVTKAGDLKKISVVQKSKDETKINNQVIISENTRKTDYNIYIISEEDPDEEHSEYYTKMYQGCVSIISECSSNSGDCQPQPLVDLTIEPKKDNSRNLEDTDKMKDSPIALCFFNITDNHIITSIACHESFPEWQKNQILLDLYFF